MMKPVKEFDGQLYYIDEQPRGYFLWNVKKKKKAKNLMYLTQLVLFVECYGYPGFFRPTWEDVRDSIPPYKFYKNAIAIEIPEQELTAANIVESSSRKIFHAVIAKLYQWREFERKLERLK